MSEEFKILTARCHVRTRMNMYLGSTSVTESERLVFGKPQIVTNVPALSKAIDEIIDNAVDEAIRTNFKFANKIDVSWFGETVTVTDNGRGIPQDVITDATTGRQLTKPEAAWTMVNSGTSFTEDRTTMGTNGVGSACVNFVSEQFVGKTWQKGKQITVACRDGANHVEVSTKDRIGKSGTEVSFVLDYSLFDVKSLHDLDTLRLIEDRLANLQLAFPEIEFTINNKPLPAKTLKQYAKNVFDDLDGVVIVETPTLSFFIAPSPNGFMHNSYVNGVNTRQGGSYMDYVTGNLAETLVGSIKRKFKIDVNKSAIRDGLTVVIYARDFKDPRFDSQTKERLTSPNGTVAKHYEASKAPTIEKLSSMVMAKSQIIDPIVDALLAKKLAAEKRAAALAAKKMQKVRVAKHISATSRDAALMLMEGDSAVGSLLQVRDPAKHGGLPLRGVVRNVWGLRPAEVLKNKELTEIMAVIGLDIRDPDSVDGRSYKDVWIMVDADHDGAGHIAPLLMGFFYQFWPRLVTEGHLHLVRSPMQISTDGKRTEWFYNYDEAEKFKAKHEKWDHRYIKGLAQLSTEEYYRVVNSPVLDTVTIDDVKFLEVMLGDDVNLRKEFLI